MNTVSTSEARNNLADLFNRAAYGHERTRVTRKGQPVAAIVPLEDLDAMEALEDLMDLKAAKASIRDAEEHGGAINAEEYFASLEEREEISSED